MGSISNPQVDIVDLDGNGDPIQVTDGANFTKKLSVLVQGDAGSLSGGLLALGLDPSNNAKALTFDVSGNLKVTGGGGGEQHLSGDSITGGRGTVAMGSDGTSFRFLRQTATNYNLITELAVAGSLIDPRQIRALTNSDVVKAQLQDNAGTAITLGQKAGASSLPASLSTDQMYAELTSIVAKQGVGILGNDAGAFRWLKVDATGALQIAIQPSPNTYFNFGDINTSATAQVPVRRTAYTEQTTNAQRSIASASANDTNTAGTGARTVTIQYYDQTGAGPYTETVALNGTTYVNTVATNICFIERMVVASVGSTGSNVGIITLKAAITGGGATIGTIAATDNRTFWAHHYVATGLTMKVTGISCSHNGTTVGSGALFILKARAIGVATAPEMQIADFVRLYGQSSTFSRNYNSPISVAGPARVIMYVTPESTSSFFYRTAFDYSEA